MSLAWGRLYPGSIQLGDGLVLAVITKQMLIKFSLGPTKKMLFLYSIFLLYEKCMEKHKCIPHNLLLMQEFSVNKHLSLNNGTKMTSIIINKTFIT